jgi:OmpA family
MILTWYAILGAVFGITESIGVYFIRTVSVRDFVYYRMVQSMVLGGLTILVGQIVFGGMMLLPRILLKLTSEELIGDLTFIDDLMMAATDMFVLFGGAMVALEIVLFLPLMVAELVMEIVIGGTVTESTLLWVIGAWIGVLLIVFWVLPGWIVLYDNTKSWWKPALMLVGYALYAGPVLLLFGFIASPGDFIGSRVMPPGNTSSVPLPQSARENIYFEFGVATLTDEAEAALNDILDDIENREIDAVIITGYADTAEEAAGELSERRADTVATELVKTGIARELIRTEGVGSSDLAVPTPRGTREAANRRVTIEFVR